MATSGTDSAAVMTRNGLVVYDKLASNSLNHLMGHGKILDLYLVKFGSKLVGLDVEPSL
jgi:hypothetical protein